MRAVRRLVRLIVGRAHQNLGHDDGNIIVALMIIFVLVVAATGLTYAVVGNMSVVTARQSNSQAVALANGGLSDALYRIDQGYSDTGGGVATQFCVKAADASCLASSVPGAPGTSYLATYSNPTGTDPAAGIGSPTWTVSSKATVGSQTAAVQETVSTEPIFAFALFTMQSLDINGNSQTSFGTYQESSDGVDNVGNVDIGTEGTMKCTGGGFSPNVTAEYYQANGSTTKYSCANPMHTQVVFPPPTKPANALPCPDNGNIPDGYQWPPGTYLCTTPVTFEGNLPPPGGQVKLYIILSNPASGSAALTINGTYINDKYDENGGHGDLPTATDLQIYVAGSNTTVANSNGSGYYLGAILDAPQSTTTADGCKDHYYGSVVLASFTCNGAAAGFTFDYDQSLELSPTGQWITSDYTQIPPADVPSF